MFFFQHPLADLVVAGQRPRVHRHAVGRLVARLRRRRGRRAREGRAARPGQPRRRARLLPRHARRRLQGPGARPTSQAATQAGAAAADAVPARRATTAASASRSPSRPPRWRPPNVTVEIVDGAGHFLHARAARRRSTRRIVEFLGMTPTPNAASRLPDGLVVVVKRSARRCRMVAPLLAAVSAPPCTPRTTRRSPTASPRSTTPTSSVSWHHDIETVPTLIRVERRRRGRAHRRLAARRLAAHHRHRRPRRRPAGDAPRLRLDDRRPRPRRRAARAAFGGDVLKSRRLELADLDDEMEAMFDRGFTDGLPVVPPTEERVLRMLEGTTRDPQRHRRRRAARPRRRSPSRRSRSTR